MTSEQSSLQIDKKHSSKNKAYPTAYDSQNSIESIHTIYIDKAVEDTPLVHHLLKQTSLKNNSFNGAPQKNPSPKKIIYLDDAASFLKENRRAELNQKNKLLIYKHKGSFLSSCPGSDGMVCCQYFVINAGVGCLFDCHYCYLQTYLNSPFMTVFANLDDLFIELDKRTLDKNFHFRIGTGEYADSLALEEYTGQAKFFIDYFAKHPNATLELKTKSKNVDSLLSLNHNENTVIAWSLNPQHIIDRVEPGTASLAERIAAAKKIQDAGYKLAFHFDPLIYMENWQEEYAKLIEEVFSTISSKSVAWISAGSLRYTNHLREEIQRRFPEDNLLSLGEMVRGTDGKYRYFKSIRRELFSFIREEIKRVDEKLFIYLCMDTQLMWQQVFDYVPTSSSNLDGQFEKRRMEIKGTASV